MKEPTREEINEIIELWHLSKVYAGKRYDRMLKVVDWYLQEHPGTKSLWVYKVLERQLTGRYADQMIRRRPRLAGRASRKRPRRNPRNVKIYEDIHVIIASKKGMPHRCDAECRAADHMYIHEFKKGSGIFGRQDGSINVRRKRT